MLFYIYINENKNDFIQKPNYFNADNIFVKDNIIFNLSNIKSYHSNKFKLSKYHYYIQSFDEKFNKILPSDLTLHYNYYLFCLIIINNTINIYSLPKIVEDKFFECIEYSFVNENIQLGVILYKTNNDSYISRKYSTIYLNNNLFNY